MCLKFYFKAAAACLEWDIYDRMNVVVFFIWLLRFLGVSDRLLKHYQRQSEV